MWFLQKLYVTLDDVERFADLLVQQVSPQKFDCVVSIERGGSYPGACIAKRLGISHYRVVARRDMDLGKMYGRFPPSLRFIPALQQGVSFLTEKPVLKRKLAENEEVAIRGKTALIVDDVVQSGKTIRLVTDYLSGLSVQTRTAAITSSFGRPVDFCCIRGGLRYFPWSASSPEYPRFLELYKNIECA